MVSEWQAGIEETAACIGYTQRMRKRNYSYCQKDTTNRREIRLTHKKEEELLPIICVLEGGRELPEDHPPPSSDQWFWRECAHIGLKSWA